MPKFYNRDLPNSKRSFTSSTATFKLQPAASHFPTFLPLSQTIIRLLSFGRLQLLHFCNIASRKLSSKDEINIKSPVRKRKFQEASDGGSAHSLRRKCLSYCNQRETPRNWLQLLSPQLVSHHSKKTVTKVRVCYLRSLRCKRRSPRSLIATPQISV